MNTSLLTGWYAVNVAIYFLYLTAYKKTTVDTLRGLVWPPPITILAITSNWVQWLAVYICFFHAEIPLFSTLAGFYMIPATMLFGGLLCDSWTNIVPTQEPSRLGCAFNFLHHFACGFVMITQHLVAYSAVSKYTAVFCWLIHFGWMLEFTCEERVPEVVFVAMDWLFSVLVSIAFSLSVVAESSTLNLLPLLLMCFARWAWAYFMRSAREGSISRWSQSVRREPPIILMLVPIFNLI